MSALALLWKLRRYWPIIKLVLALLRENKPRLDELVARKETSPKEDARDFFREADDDEFWDRMSDYG